MKRMDPARIASARKSLRKKKVFAFPSLLSLLNCSTRTGRKQLKQWRTYNSYNLNARFYALPEVPRFDDNGLWKCKDAYFSKHGTLKRTVVSLVQNSLSGLDGNEISKLVGLPHQSFLHHFRDVPGMRREKHDGVFVYFSDDERYAQQAINQRDRHALCAKHLTDADAVVILVAVIKHHDITVDELAMIPEIKKHNFSPTILRAFFDRHGLGKKTPNSEL